MSPSDVIDGLAKRFPVLVPLLEKHRTENFGETLPHVFLADVARWAGDEFKQASSGGEDVPEVMAVFDYLEDCFATGGSEVQELLGVSFVGLLPSTGEPGEGIRELLGPLLQAEYGRMNW